MVRPLIDPGAPPWALKFALNLPNVFKGLSPKSPERLAPFAFAELPPPASWAGCTVYVTDKAKVGLSNGTTWTDTIGGAL